MRANRRQFLGTAAWASCGLALGRFLHLRAAAAGPAAPTADAGILIFLNGGMSHLDTFDPKPDQPAEIRGEFASVATTVPGIRFTEHWPRLAQQAHHLAIVRSVGFEGRLANHSPACYHMLTGVAPEGEAALLAAPQRTDHPSMGSVAARMRPVVSTVPAYVMAPDVLIENAHLTPGQFAGWLGSSYEGLCLRGDPSQPDFAVPSLTPATDVPRERLNARRHVLERVEAQRRDLTATPASLDMATYYQRAFALLTSSRAESAFHLSAEPAPLRDRYGRDTFGQSMLLARRLVEAGVRFVNVHWPNVGGGRNWDTHSNGFARLRDTLIPPTDRAVAALLADLADRGLLERTLVVVLTEFGRAPQIGRTFQNSGGPAGRDHWSNCFSILLAGGGLPAGCTYGQSDSRGAYAADRAATPADVVATIYQALGIDPAATLHDSEQRAHRLCTGTPLWR
jgi:uncharacterized protein (DUF1501 family)